MKLNSSYWQDPDFKEQVQNEMKEFFELNSNDKVSIWTIWASGKVYLRGTIIKYAAAKNKERIRYIKK